MFLCSAVLLATVATVGAGQVNSGELVDRGLVRLAGVVSSVVRDDTDENHNWMIIRTPQGKVCAAVADRIWSFARLKGLRDAEVEITGHVRPMVAWRQFLGYLLVVGSRPDIRVTKPPPEDPFAGPSLGTDAEPHRQTVAGSVLARTSRRFFVRRANGDFLPVTPAEEMAMPPVGARIVIAGFADRDQRNLQFVEAVWRRETDGDEPLEPCIAVGMDELFWQYGHRMANLGVYGRSVCIAGEVMRMGPDGRVFRLVDGRNAVDVDLSGFGEDSVLPSVGARIEVRGVCYADFESDKSTMVFPRFRGFIVIPRVADDIRVLVSAPWWTAGRLLVLTALLLSLVVFFVVWSVLLKRLAAKRARELADERIASARAELKVEERTRLAVELHDSLSQTLTGVALQIDAAESAAAEGVRADGFLTTARRMLDSCRQELCACLWDLRGRTFEEKDMTEAILRSVRPRVGDVELDVRFDVPRTRLSEERVHAVLRIVRELVANAVAHGKARHVRVVGELHDGFVSFSVADDGTGFDPETAAGPAGGHFGLQGVRERLREFGGTLSVDSAPGRGTRFAATLRAEEETEG